MTMLYGSLVGALKQTVPPTSVPATRENGTDHVLIRDTIELAAAAVADTVELCHALPWETIISPASFTIYNDALGTGVTVSVGCVGHTTALAAATACSSAGSFNGMKSVDIADYWKPLWQQLGFATLAAAKAVAPACQLLAYIVAASTTASGTLTWSFHGQRR